MNGLTVLCFQFRYYNAGFSFLLYDEFSCRVTHIDEIHALGQIRHINLLCFSGDSARFQGLTHRGGDVVGLGLCRHKFEVFPIKKSGKYALPTLKLYDWSFIRNQWFEWPNHEPFLSHRLW